MWGEIDRDKENQEKLDKQTGIDRPKEQKEWLESHYQTYRSPDPPPQNETWTQRIERERREGRNPSPNSPNPKGGGGGRGLKSIVIALFFMYGLFYFNQALAQTVNSAFSSNGWESTHHFSMQLLKIFVQIFSPLSTIAVAVIAFIALGRGLGGFFGTMLKGVMGIAVGGLLIFFGAFFYLVFAGVIGK